MQRLHIDTSIFEWLCHIKVLQEKSVVQKSGNRVILDEYSSNQFWSGIKIKKIIQAIMAVKGLEMGSKLDLKNSSAFCQHNWKQLEQALMILNIPLDLVLKQHFIKGDFGQINILLQQLKDVYDKSYQLSQKQQKARLQEQRIDISKLDLKKQLNQCKNLLEYLIISLSNNLELNPKQVLQLLAEKGKFLGQMLLKGIRGDFEKVQNWIETLDWQDAQQVMKEGEAELFVELIQFGIISESEQICQESLRILLQASESITLYQHMNQLIIRALLKHQNLQQLLNQLLLIVNKNDQNSLFFEILVQNTDQLQYLSLLRPLAILVNNQIEIQQQIIENILQIKTDQFEVKIKIINLALDIWVVHYQELDNSLFTQILNKIKQYKKNNQFILRSTVICQLFRLFELYYQEDKKQDLSLISEKQFKQKFNQQSLNTSQLPQSNQQISQQLYRLLIFQLIERHDEEQIREIMIQNFKYLYEKYQNLNSQVLLESLLKQIQIRQNISYIINIFDIELLKLLCEHKSINVIYGIQLFQTLQNIYLNNLVFSQTLFESLKMLILRFIDCTEFQHYLQNFLRHILLFYVDQENMYHLKKSQYHQIKLFNAKELIVSVLQFQNENVNNQEFQRHLQLQFYHLQQKRNMDNQDLFKMACIIDLQLKPQVQVKDHHLSKLLQNIYKIENSIDVSENKSQVINKSQLVNKSQHIEEEKEPQSFRIRVAKSKSIVDSSKQMPVIQIEFKMFDYQNDEQINQLSLDQTLQKESKTFAQIFRIIQNQNNIKQNEQIQCAILHRFVHQFQVNIKIQQTQNLVKKLTNNISVNLQQFISFLIQISHYHYKFRQYVPIGVNFQYFIDQIKLRLNIIDQNLYDLNQRFQQNEQMQIPEGFQTKTIKVLDYKFDLPQSLRQQVNEPTQIVYDIITQILSKNLQIQLNEYQSSFQNKKIIKRNFYKINDYIGQINKTEFQQSPKEENQLVKNQENVMIQSEKKRQLRQQELKEKIEQHKLNQLQVDQEKQQKLDQIQNIKKQREEERKLYLQSLKEKLEKQYIEKQEQLKIQQNEEEQNRSQENQEKKKKQVIFLKTQQKRISKSFQQKKVLMQEEQQKQQEISQHQQQKDQQLKSIILQKINQQNQLKEKVIQEKEQKDNQYLEQEDLLLQYKEKLNKGFQFYLQQEIYENGFKLQNISIKNFYKLCSDIDIYQGNDVKMMQNLITKLKKEKGQFFSNEEQDRISFQEYTYILFNFSLEINKDFQNFLNDLHLNKKKFSKKKGDIHTIGF